MRYSVDFLRKFRDSSSFIPEGDYSYTVTQVFVNEEQNINKPKADILNIVLSLTDSDGNQYKTTARYYQYQNMTSTRLENFITDLKNGYRNTALYDRLFPKGMLIEEQNLVGTTGTATIVHREVNGKVYINVDRLIP